MGVRWTIGDVSPRGFYALALSLLGAFRVFGERARYAVYVNTLPIDEVKRRVLPLDHELERRIEWHDATLAMPGWLRARFEDGRLAEGAGWKLAPIRAFPDAFELALDNDVVLWECPAAISEWLAGTGSIVADDAFGCFGKFSDYAGQKPANLGLRGLPPGQDFERALRELLIESDLLIGDSNDEQGLQLGAMRRMGEPLRVSLEDVTICSPFPPHLPHLGRCGAHFVGLNTHLPWHYYDRAADSVRAEHWDSLEDEVRRRVLADCDAELADVASPRL